MKNYMEDGLYDDAQPDNPLNDDAYVDSDEVYLAAVLLGNGTNFLAEVLEESDVAYTFFNCIMYINDPFRGICTSDFHPFSMENVFVIDKLSIQFITTNVNSNGKHCYYSSLDHILRNKAESEITAEAYLKERNEKSYH